MTRRVLYPRGIGCPYFRLRRRELSGNGPGKSLSAFVPAVGALSRQRICSCRFEFFH